MCEHSSSGRLSATTLPLKHLLEYTKFPAYKITMNYQLWGFTPTSATTTSHCKWLRVQVPLGWLLLHSHSDPDRRNPFAIVYNHGTAALPRSAGVRLTQSSLSCGVGKKKKKATFQKNNTTGAHIKLLLMEWLKGVTEKVLQIKEWDDTSKRAKNKSKQDRQISGKDEAADQY